MGRYCGDCGLWCDRYDFSLNQWQKGEGGSRCKNCIAGVTYECNECFRQFNSRNSLDQHMQVHRPRNVACPVCNEVRFRSGANAVQHVESGYCSGCRGRDNARQQIYNFASSKSTMKPYMTSVPRLTNGGGGSYGAVPDYPYKCPSCAKSFQQLSQLLQHKDAKHNSTHLLGYY